VRTYGVARALAAHRGLDLLYARFDAPEPDATFREIPGIALHAAEPSRGARRLLAYADALLSGVPAGFARGISPELVARASALASAEDRGRVIADGPIAAAALRRLAGRRPVIYNAHNLESAFRGDLTGASRRHVRALQRFERAVLARAAEAWMVSEPDLQGARALCPSAKLRYAPNVVDVAAIAPVTTRASERRALFVASFSYEPNRDGLRFLLEEVFPRVWAQLPDARLALVGAGLERPPSEDPRVEALGFVEDLGGAYARARCVVVPLLRGGGTPLKLLEALAYGLPVVATPRATSGLEGLHDGEHCLIAGDAPAFAAALVRVLGEDAADSEGAAALGRNGRELVERRYSIETLSSLLAP
jgi:glycosyltransferase involved in cell wall biosynthesis